MRLILEKYQCVTIFAKKNFAPIMPFIRSNARANPALAGTFGLWITHEVVKMKLDQLETV